MLPGFHSTLARKNGKEDFLDYIYPSGTSSRFHAPALVGAGSYHPNCVLKLVDRLSQRLVLNQEVRLHFSVIPTEVEGPASCLKCNFNILMAGPLAASSNVDAPITTDLDIAAHNLR